MEDEHDLTLDGHMAWFYWTSIRGAWPYWLIEVEDDSHMTSTCHSSKGG